MDKCFLFLLQNNSSTENIFVETSANQNICCLNRLFKKKLNAYHLPIDQKVYNSGGSRGGLGDPDPPIRPEEFIAFCIIHSKTISRIHQNELFRA